VRSVIPDAIVNASLLRSPGGGNRAEAGLGIIAPARLRDGYGSVKMRGARGPLFGLPAQAPPKVPCAHVPPSSCASERAPPPSDPFSVFSPAEPPRHRID
jgi:hypothetical protein